ncbi:MAG: transglutaminase domain-containing protein [Gammaproteobacteria bacterium]
MGLPTGLPGVRTTLKHMAALVKAYKVDPGVRELSQDLTRHLASYDRSGEIGALHRFCRDQIRYVGDVESVETLQTPVYTLEKGSGDCDDKAVLLNTLLASIGYQTLFFAMGMNGEFYSHVTAGVRLGTRTLVLETIVPQGSLGPGSGEPGWLPPEADPILPWNV